MLCNFNMSCINVHCGHRAVIKCSSHSNRDKVQGEYKVDTDDYVEICKFFRGVNDINIASYDSLSSITENSQGVCCNDNIECDGVLDMYPGTSPQVNCPRDAISQSVAFLGFVQPTSGIDRGTRYTPLLENMGNYYQVDFCVQENEIDCNEGHLVYVYKNQNGPITGFFRAFSSQWGTILAPNIIPTENMISVNVTYCMYLVIEPNTVDSKYAKDTYTDLV